MIYSLYPVFKDYLWGGTRLRDEYGKKSDLEKVAESWELSCHKDGISSIGLAGMDASKPVPLTEFIRIRGKAAVLGTRPAAFSSFPVMIKLIDAHDNLSVQVHPDDRYAMRWKVLSERPRCGTSSTVKKGQNCSMVSTTRSLRKKCGRRPWTIPCLTSATMFPVHKGDVFWINCRKHCMQLQRDCDRRDPAEFQPDLPSVRLRPDR